MSTPELRLKDPAYKNWVKAWLCLALVKKGLEDYAEIKSKEFHDAVLASVTKIQTYQTSICHNERITFDKNNDVKIACNHSFCQGFLNEVVNLGTDPTEKFKIRKANIENCDVKLWPTDHWELAKLFMNPGQKPYETNPSQTDLSGILNFLEHCQVPRNGIQNPQHIDEVRQTRNSVMLTPDMKVSPAMFQTDTQTMLDLLRDPNLSKLLSAKHAESEIQKVIQDDFQILLKDEYTVIEDWMTSLNNVTNDTTTEIKELRKEITSMQQTDEEEKKTLQTQIQQMKEETNKIKYSLSTLMKRVWTEGGPPGGYSLTKYLDGSIEQVIKDLQRAHNELKRQLEKTEQKLKDAAQKSEVLYDRDRLVKLELETSASKLQGAIIKAEERGVAEILSARSPHDEVLSLHHALIQKQYAVAKRLLENIGNRIKESKADDLLYVWPAYQEKQRLNPVFVALCQGYYQGEWDEVLGFRVYKRRFDYISPDTAKVINGQFLRTNNALIPKDIDISKHIASSEILKKHSNITIINACRYKSTNGSLIDQECIVIHCGMKGFIPIDEEPFPRYIGSHPVDVREGYFKLGMNTPPWTSSTSRRKLINGSFANSNSENAESGQLAAPLKASKTADRIKPRNKYSYNAKIKRFAPYSVPKREKGYNEMNDASVRTNIDDLCEEFQTLSMCQFGNRPSDVNEVLLMGTSISKQGGMSTGTLGGFVALPDRKVGFITCAHVFSEVDGKSLCEVEGKSVCQPSDGDVSIAQRQRRRVCGRVRKAEFKKGSFNVPGVDAALVEITDRVPKDGLFIEVSTRQLSRAGFDLDKPPMFSTGKILKYSDIKKYRHISPLKVGSQTGLTRGMFYLNNSFVQTSNEILGLPGEKQISFYNQMEILSLNNSTVFFDLGDSGSLVFIPIEDELYCVGLAIGRTSYYSCLVTPIECVLKALNLNEDSLMDFISLHA